MGCELRESNVRFAQQVLDRSGLEKLLFKKEREGAVGVLVNLCVSQILASY